MKISFTTRLEEGGPNKRQRAAARAAKLGAAVDRRIAHELSPQEIARKRDVETAGLKVLPKPQGKKGYHSAAINPTADGMPSPEALKTAHKATARHQANPQVDKAQKKIMGTARLSEPAGSPVPTKRIPSPGEAPGEPELVMHRPGGEVVAKGVLGDLASKPKPVSAPEPSKMTDTHSVPRAAKELPASVPKLSAKTTLPKKSMETEQQKFDREKAEVLAKDPDAFKKGKFAPEAPKKPEPRRQSPAPPRPESPDFWDKPL